jgi:hypothetical protein
VINTAGGKNMKAPQMHRIWQVCNIHHKKKDTIMINKNQFKLRNKLTAAGAFS